MEKQDVDQSLTEQVKYYEGLIAYQHLFEKAILEMNDKELIDFYKYCLSQLQVPRDLKDRLPFVMCDLEDLPVIQMYMSNKSKENNLDKSDDEIINEILDSLERKRKAKNNPINKLIRYFKA
ncbi:MAG: hypothetical protein IJ475_01235 [Bacilli bacterium]|nr:hypothetical protein [Bacilli bacterium]